MAAAHGVQAPSSSCTIRSAKDRDFIACIEIVREAWPEFPERNSIYHLFTKHFSSTSFVAELDGTVVGFLLAFRSASHPELGYAHLVATRPSRQRGGIATALYRRAFATLQELGCQEIRCIINPSNHRSLKFHIELGFAPSPTSETVQVNGVAATRDYNGPGVHMVEMRRWLTPPA